MVQLHDGLTLNQKVLESYILSGLEINLTWFVNGEVVRDTEPVELTHVKKESVEDSHLFLIDLLHDLFGYMALVVFIKVRLGLRCPRKDGVVAVPERNRIIVRVVPSDLNHSFCRLSFFSFDSFCVKVYELDIGRDKGKPVLGVDLEFTKIRADKLIDCIAIGLMNLISNGL